MRIIDADVINALKSQGYKTKSGSTLRYWKKAELIEQINILEHNWGNEIIAHNRGVKYAEDLLQTYKEKLVQMKKEWLNKEPKGAYTGCFVNGYYEALCDVLEMIGGVEE